MPQTYPTPQFPVPYSLSSTFSTGSVLQLPAQPLPPPIVAPPEFLHVSGLGELLKAPIEAKGPPKVEAAELPKGSRVLGPSYCISCGTTLDRKRYLNLITLTRDKGMTLQQAIEISKYDKQPDPKDNLVVTKDIAEIFEVSKPRAISMLLRSPRMCCVTEIQNPSVGVVTRIHTGISKSGEPMTKLYQEVPTEILTMMFGETHPLVRERAIPSQKREGVRSD